jgi:hypothetical protein
VARLLGEATMTRFAVVERDGHRPHYARGWPRYTLTTPNGHEWRVFLPPHPPAAPRS